MTRPWEPLAAVACDLLNLAAAPLRALAAPVKALAAAVDEWACDRVNRAEDEL